MQAGAAGACQGFRRHPRAVGAARRSSRPPAAHPELPWCAADADAARAANCRWSWGRQPWQAVLLARGVPIESAMYRHPCVAWQHCSGDPLGSECGEDDGTRRWVDDRFALNGVSAVTLGTRAAPAHRVGTVQTWPSRNGFDAKCIEEATGACGVIIANLHPPACSTEVRALTSDTAIALSIFACY